MALPAQTAPSWRRSARLATMQREMVAAQTRSRVICALNLADGALSIGGIADATGLSYDRARRALETLTAMHIVTVSGPKNNQRFSLTGMVNGVGGPASTKSAVEDCAGESSASAARPGIAAA